MPRQKKKTTDVNLKDAGGLESLHKKPVRMKRGRQDISPKDNNPTKITTKQAQRGLANRGNDTGPSKGRGDRRDTNPMYTGNRRVQANHTNPAGGQSRSNAARGK
jgi:hypothetical protein